jgi:hypothetical protein
MGTMNRMRRRARAAVALVALAALAAAVSPVAQADVANPGTVQLVVTHGSATVAGQETPFGTPEAPLPAIGLPATFAKDGTFVIPLGGITFPPFTTTVGDYEVALTIGTDHINGRIDPATGVAEMDLGLAVEVAPTVFPVVCVLHPRIPLRSANPGGVPYDATLGTATLVSGPIDLGTVTAKPVGDPIGSLVCPLIAGLIGSDGTGVPALPTDLGFTLGIRTTPALQPAIPPSRVTGTVRDVRGRPVRGIVVEAHTAAGASAAETTTRRDGQFSLRLPAPGDYKLRVVDPTRGHHATWVGGDSRSTARTLSIGPGATRRVAPRVAGTSAVVAAAGNRRGSPVRGLRVAVYRSGSWVAAATTRASGEARIGRLAPGTYKVRVADPRGRYRTAWLGGPTRRDARPVELRPHRITDLTLRVRPR